MLNSLTSNAWLIITGSGVAAAVPAVSPPQRDPQDDAEDAAAAAAAPLPLFSFSVHLQMDMARIFILRYVRASFSCQQALPIRAFLEREKRM